MIIVDSSVLIDYLKGVDSVQVTYLDDIIHQAGDYRIPAICCQEVLQGARDEHEWRQLHQYLTTQTVLVPSDPLAAHISAARIYYDCRRRGHTIRSTIDCFIAFMAIENNAVLLHNDRDFEAISSCTPLKVWDLPSR
jgi:predicted nucleic acid-binding protein